MNTSKIYDFIGIGVGPFNLGLAALTEPIQELQGLFFDQSTSFDWHPGMMIEGTTLQIPFIADLVTLADPTNPYSFLNYIKQAGRIYAFYIRENFLLLRKEYNQYCQWVIQQLPNVHFQSRVDSIHYNASNKLYEVSVFHQPLQKTLVYKTKKIVLGTGTSPHIPKCCLAHKETLIHSSNYLAHKKQLQQQKSITIVGSGQSAAEIFYDLLQDIDHMEYELNWITRSDRYFPLEYTKLTLEMTSPEYVDYFYRLPAAKRDAILQRQKHLYKGINGDLINAIYDLLYTKRLSKPNINVQLQTHSTLKEVRPTTLSELELTFHQHQQDAYYELKTEGLVLATGYTYRLPKFLESIHERIQWDDKGRFDVQRNYSIDTQNNAIFVQNAELHTHGFVTPDLGMAAYRNSYIIKEMTGIDYYPIEQKIAFQQFEVDHTSQLQLKDLEHQV
ncbi:lysine N(6)-hydroxylase/L-ornithine N(5)-oxygenase family protein [Aureispira sp. CCB-QB1]|uniref:lysine N(6)-hydroxylase/L-ornithine N(5)-oxygenase family protein n=1 Tax=Aureispira sp. CCB-QB1 TaxID=1313421 RepID=UPI000AFC18CB|nr:lysine N(6)-hydroxylase/L-ornithine N(5)-oxygenase family protein [Aureispira sp. CCB-QB1]